MPMTASPMASQSERHHPCDNGSGGEHYADLERSRGDLVVMIARQCNIALFLSFLSALGQFDGALPYIRLGAIACRDLLPGVDLLHHRCP